MESKPSRERSRVVTGMFKDRESAERAYKSVTDRGYTPEDVNLLMSKDTREKYFSSDDSPKSELGNKALKGAGAGSAEPARFAASSVAWAWALADS